MRKIGGREVLSLFDEHTGTVALPREWTDQAPPCPYSSVLEQPPVLHAVSLLKLLELVQMIGKRIDDDK
jgi:Family of unknown function (DUF5372)